MSEIRLATGPVSWGVNFADAPDNPPWEHVLDEIARTGLGAMELGPIGYLPEDHDTLCEALASREILATGSFVFDDFHATRRAEEILGATERSARAIRSAGGSILVLIDRPSEARAATAGRSADAKRLAGPDWRAMVDLIEQAAAVAADHGLRACVHPHAGTYVEFADEVERLLASSSVDLCLDTGHIAYAGEDAGATIRRHASRVAHIHLKDVDGIVLARVHDEGRGFWDAITAGAFCPMGTGVVPVAEVAQALADARYTGYATVEQDRIPGHGSPLDDLMASIAVLERAGFSAGSARCH